MANAEDTITSASEIDNSRIIYPSELDDIQRGMVQRYLNDESQRKQLKRSRANCNDALTQNGALSTSLNQISTTETIGINKGNVSPSFKIDIGKSASDDLPKVLNQTYIKNDAGEYSFE